MGGPRHEGVRRGGVLAVVGFFCVAGAAACGLFSDATGDTGGRYSATPAPSTPSVVETDAAGLVTKLPEIDRAVSGALPSDVVKGRLWSDPFNDRMRDEHFSWTVLDARRNRVLTLQVTRKASIAEAMEKAAYVRKELAGDRTREGRQVVSTGPLEKAAGIAEECLGFRISRENAVSGVIGDPRQDYSMSGRYLYCRFKNVNMVIDWEGQDYARPWAVGTGTGLDQATAGREVQQVARAVVAALR
ncbi:hypothetical protein SAMN05443665_1013186 [Actinomadura meyerae]|uniref:Lipoprotein n=1 Tax=Actinomadura meyerae TaxID=240840 RepID=A0A239J4N7_9ACTN|nr:hypothetical protein [Actinomadura meyerae]SNS99614.1 hypothetical protein SAMN05443665_1013186 [Actinomadura meyerae]